MRTSGNILESIILELTSLVWSECHTYISLKNYKAPISDISVLFFLLIAANKEVWQFKIPPTFYCFWQPLLSGLLSRSFTQILIEKMFIELKECPDSSELRPQFLINWISELLTGIAKVNAGECVWNFCV